MKLKHTQKKSANRIFYKGATGFQNKRSRKQANQIMNSPDRSDKRFTKKKPIRKNIVRTTYPKN